ncbi:MAG: histidinol dehydrogenase [Planctomycetota bacterium]|jgi:histidinol dehydrogenase|nr:histidinol dehydrogenase [Planctomycetota bacterium]
MLEPRSFSPTDPRFLAILARGADLDAELGGQVAGIIQGVRLRGGDGLLEYVRRFDADLPDIDSIRVSPEEIRDATARTSGEFLADVRKAAGNIRRFHSRQGRRDYVNDDGDGVALARRVLPLARVGVYCPAGTAPLFSTLLMNVIPARLAGVPEIAVAIPSRRDGGVHPHMLAVAAFLEIDEIYKMGGAHAIAALAYGAGPVRRVDKIVGPGNAYVAEAKRQVFGTVGIDSPAGPSELAIIADAGADPEFIAADLLSQAEHGSGREAAVLLTDSAELAAAAAAAMAERRLAGLGRSEAVGRALSRYGAIFITQDILQAVDAANVIAPEHLEIMTREPERLLPEVVNAGAVFLGPWSSEPVGDYFAGTNHVLPTNGAARFSSGLGVADFQKEMSVISYSRERLRQAGPAIIRMAEAEGLTAHADAIRARLPRLGQK